MRLVTLILVSALGLSAQAFTDNDKQIIRDFFFGQTRINDAVLLAKGVEFTEPPSQFAAALHSSIQETCVVETEHNDFLDRLDLSGDLCVMPGEAVSRVNYGNGIASGEDTLVAEVKDMNYSETTGRRKLNRRVQWNAQEYQNGQFRGQIVENSRHEMVSGDRGFLDARSDYSGTKDISGDYNITHWTTNGQMRVGNNSYQLRVNMNPQGSYCAINNYTLSCDEFWTLVGGQEEQVAQVQKALARK